MDPKRTVFMTPATRQMAADTVMRYRQMMAALDAVSIHEWPTVRHFPPDNPERSSRCAVWENAFLSEECTTLPRYLDWFQTEFGDVPDLFRRRAVVSTGYSLGRRRLPDPSRRDLDLRELLAMRRWWQPLHLEFGLRRRPEQEVIERPTWGRLRLRLFDRSTSQWGWQEAAFETETTPPVPLTEEGVEMLPVPRLNAGVIVQLTRRLNLSSDELVEIETVLDRLPFSDLTIPPEYWDADEAVGNTVNSAESP